MSSAAKAPTNVPNIGVVMFTVADQDAALAFYTEKLGYEVRGDTHFGENGEMRWLEVAPPGSRARLALNPPMGGEPGGGSIGVGTADVLGEHARLSEIGASPSTPSRCAHPALRSCLGCATRTATGSSWWRTTGSVIPRALRTRAPASRASAVRARCRLQGRPPPTRVTRHSSGR